MLFSIRNIRASRVNLLMNDYAAGLPSPLAFLGLGGAIAGDLGLDRWTVRTLPVLHAVWPSPGRTKPEMEPSSGTFGPIEIAEDMIGTVELSLLMDIPQLDDTTALKSAFVGRRIAGGLIQNDWLEISAVTADGSAFRTLRRGYAVVPPDDPARRLTSRGDYESLRVLAETLYPAAREPGSGWTVPVSVGYRLLEDPETAPKRRGSRCPETPHVFAEPLAGIAELVSIRNRRLTAMTADEFSARLWSWHAEDDLILGHRAYHPSPSNEPKEYDNGQI